MGKPAYTTDQIISALQETKGMVYLAAERLGCHHQTVYNYIERHPSVKAAWQSETGKMVDIGELKLYQAIQNGEAWAIALLLRTKGKDRGYVERHEQTGKDGGPIEIKEHEFDYGAARAEIEAGSNGYSRSPGKNKVPLNGA